MTKTKNSKLHKQAPKPPTYGEPVSNPEEEFYTHTPPTKQTYGSLVQDWSADDRARGYGTAPIPPDPKLESIPGTNVVPKDWARGPLAQMGSAPNAGGDDEDEEA